MAFSLPYWFFAVLPLIFLVAGLFWGAPLLSLCAELGSLITGKPFPSRCARQISRMGIMGHTLFWVLLSIWGLLLLHHPLWTHDLVSTHRILILAGLGVPVVGSLLYLAYDLTWKKARKNKGAHFFLGVVANLALKYGYWSLVVISLVAFRNLPWQSPAFIPPLASALWPVVCLWLPLSVLLAASLGLGYVVLRRNKDDWGRDYYRYAPLFLAKGHLFAGVLTFMVLAWLFFSLQGIFNLFLPQIWYPALVSLAGLALALLCSAWLLCTDNPMRFKGLMFLGVVFSYLHIGFLVIAILETLNRYVPGWDIATFSQLLVQ
ncbi:MAG: hypothetical protein RBR42_03445 [Desulfomicrobium sp.]|nr:hypothetical protein [Desulfomicrobium sp.]